MRADSGASQQGEQAEVGGGEGKVSDDSQVMGCGRRGQGQMS